MASEIFELGTAQKSRGELRFRRFLHQNDRNDPIFFRKFSRRPKTNRVILKIRNFVVVVVDVDDDVVVVVEVLLRCLGTKLKGF